MDAPGGASYASVRNRPHMPRVLLIGGARALENALRRHPALADVALEYAAGSAHALRLLRHTTYDAVLTDPVITVDEDLALLEEMRHIRPGVKVKPEMTELPPEAVTADSSSAAAADAPVPETAQ